MKTRIMAFIALILIAMVWHFFLVRTSTLAPSAQTPEAEMTSERTPATTEKTKGPGPGAQLPKQVGEAIIDMAMIAVCLNSVTCNCPRTETYAYRTKVTHAGTRVLANRSQ